MSKAGRVRVSFFLAFCPSLRSEKECLDKLGCAGPSLHRMTLLTVLTGGGQRAEKKKGERFDAFSQNPKTQIRI